MQLPAGDLVGRHVLLGLSGGVACYKGADLARELVKAGATVQAVMTESACRFIGPATLQALTGRPVFTSQWDPRQPNGMAHIDLTRSADAVLVAPAMNREMWSHPATQRNVAQLRADGTVVLGPAEGEQACGETGDGRMLEPAELRDELVGWLQPKTLAGRRVLVTAGPTFEAIDPVRGITNLSSGKMGFAVARAAAEAGAEVTLVAGPVALGTPRGVRRIDVASAEQMLAAVLPLARTHGVFVATAAVADWRPVEVAAQKIKKDGSGEAPVLRMAENPDILATVARLPEGERPYCVGFAAESHDIVRHAREKRLRKGVPLIVANDGPAAFGSDHNALVLVDAAGEQALPAGDKRVLARLLVAEIARRLAAA